MAPVSSCMCSAVYSNGRLRGRDFIRIRLRGDPRSPARRLGPRLSLRPAQDERDLLLAELGPLHRLYPGESTKTESRVFSLARALYVPSSRTRATRAILRMQ